MCLPWAITNRVWEFYSFKHALGAHSLSQRPRHDLGTDGKICLKLYEFLLHFDKVDLKKRGNQKTMIIQHNLTYILFGFLWLWCLVKCIFLNFVSPSPKSFPSMQMLPGLISVSILMDTPGTMRKNGILFSLFQAQ